MEVEGVIIPVSNGKFTIKRFSPVDETLLITATDKSGNKSEKIVKIIIDKPERGTTIVVGTPSDKIKPIIDIKTELTFNDPEYVLKGKVTDKGGSKNLYLFIKKGDEERRLVTKKKGKFEIPRFSLDDEELTLIAIDESQNKSTKIVKVIIDIKEPVEVAKIYDQLKPIEKGKKDNNRIALIIGVEKYENTPVQALFANNDAKLFKYFANKSLGISPSNIKLLIDHDARHLDVIEALKAWLPSKIMANKSELFVFFSGHGYPSKDGDLYLIPQNGDPRFLEESALSQKYIIDQIKKLNPRSVTMFFDACYSGQSRTGEVLIAGLKPLAIVPDDPDIPSNFSIFSSSEYNQISATIKEAKHGIFSYYLMKGLQGNADENGNKRITNNELIAYLKTNISQEALTQNREQNPMLSTQNLDQVLMKY